MHRANSFNSYYLFGDEPMMFDIPVEIDFCRFKNKHMGAVNFQEWKKEHPFMGSYDTDNSLHFENADSFTEYQVKKDIRIAIENYEPRAIVDDIIVRTDDLNEMRVKIIFRMRNVKKPIDLIIMVERVR